MPTWPLWHGSGGGGGGGGGAVFCFVFTEQVCGDGDGGGDGGDGGDGTFGVSRTNLAHVSFFYSLAVLLRPADSKTKERNPAEQTNERIVQ